MASHNIPSNVTIRFMKCTHFRHTETHICVYSIPSGLFVRFDALLMILFEFQIDCFCEFCLTFLKGQRLRHLSHLLRTFLPRNEQQHFGYIHRKNTSIRDQTHATKEEEASTEVTWTSSRVPSVVVSPERWRKERETDSRFVFSFPWNSHVEEKKVIEKISSSCRSTFTTACSIEYPRVVLSLFFGFGFSWAARVSFSSRLLFSRRMVQKETFLTQDWWRRARKVFLTLTVRMKK